MSQTSALAYTPAAQSLAGKVILITGAGDGIGKTLALECAKQGAEVILLGKTVAKLEAVYDAIIAAGGIQPSIVPMDLKGATLEHYKGLAETIEEQFGALHGLVHNAGILGVLGPFEHTDMKLFDEVMKVNVTAPVMLTRELLPLMKKSVSSIIFTSSSVGKQGRAYWNAYGISKFAVEGTMQTLADELVGTRVRANCINPGGTATGMRANAFPAEDPSQLKTPADIMAPYLYLLSDESQAVNGLSIDAQPK